MLLHYSLIMSTWQWQSEMFLKIEERKGEERREERGERREERGERREERKGKERKGKERKGKERKSALWMNFIIDLGISPITNCHLLSAREKSKYLAI